MKGTLEILNMAHQHGSNGVSFKTSTGKYFTTSIDGHGVYCGVDERVRRSNGILRPGCVPECRTTQPFWSRFLADIGWHWATFAKKQKSRLA